jgi:hypothetical protein
MRIGKVNPRLEQDLGVPRVYRQGSFLSVFRHFDIARFAMNAEELDQREPEHDPPT